MNGDMKTYFDKILCAAKRSTIGTLEVKLKSRKINIIPHSYSVRNMI